MKAVGIITVALVIVSQVKGEDCGGMDAKTFCPSKATGFATTTETFKADTRYLLVTIECEDEGKRVIASCNEYITNSNPDATIHDYKYSQNIRHNYKYHNVHNYNYDQNGDGASPEKSDED